MSKTEFSKKYLYSKDATELLNKYHKHIILLQNLRNEIELLKKSVLNDTELETLVNSPHDFIKDFKESIKAKFQFKNASEQFNLDANGITFQGLNNAINNIPETDYKFQIISDRIQTLDSEIKRIEDSQKVFTTSQKQNEILQICDNLCNGFEKLNELYPIGAAYEISRSTNNLLKVGYNEAGKPMPKVNYEMIEYLD